MKESMKLHLFLSLSLSGSRNVYEPTSFHRNRGEKQKRGKDRIVALFCTRDSARDIAGKGNILPFPLKGKV